MSASEQTIEFLRPDWPAPAHVRAVCSTRAGGVSTGPYASLNLAAHVGDDPDAVVENRRRLVTALSLPREPAWLEQVHGTTVVDAATVVKPIRADASIATQPESVCAVLTADCLPVLFCTRDGDRVGAAHAGWRGLAAGVLSHTIAALTSNADTLLAWLGPAIEQDAFEIGDEVREQFVKRDAETTNAFIRNARGRWQADLYKLARLELQRLGVTAIYGGGECCYADAKRFFSYRRDGQTGRMASLIWMV